MKRQRVLITYQALPDEKTLFREILGSKASVEFLGELTLQRRQPALQSATVLISWNFLHEISTREYSHLEHVGLIQLLSAGADQMPFADLPSQIIIAGNVGAYAMPMAEHVMGMILALAKRLCLQNEKLRKGEWDKFTPNRLLSGMMAGILGFGGIGRATARLLRAFDMRIWAINTTGSSSEPTDFIGTLQDLEKVLRAGDVVVISLPLTRATRGLLGKEQLDWMKPDAILINVSRGDVVEQGALYTHVKDHPDFLVGIDAWWTEPSAQGRFQTEYPFLELPNVLGSPHNSAIVPNIWSTAARQAAQNVARYIMGEKVTGVVRREDYM